jgi:hypothetical protein
MGRNDSSALRLAVLGTSLIGAGYIAVTYSASEFVVNAIGGSGCAELYSEVWLFAIKESLFAVLQVLPYREDTKVSFYLMLGSLCDIKCLINIFCDKCIVSSYTHLCHIFIDLKCRDK